MKKIIIVSILILFSTTVLCQKKSQHPIHMEGTYTWLANTLTKFQSFSKIGVQIKLNNETLKRKLDYFAGIQVSQFNARTGYIKTSNTDGFSIERNTPNLALSANVSFITTRRFVRYKLTAAIGIPFLFDKGLQSFTYPDCIIHHSQKGNFYHEVQNSLVLNWSKRLQQDFTLGLALLNNKENYLIEYIPTYTRPKVVSQNREYGHLYLGLSFRYKLGQ